MTKNIITVIIRRIIAVIKPTTKINDYISNAKTIYQSMRSNAYFPATALSITMAQYNTDVMALDAAQINLHSSPPSGTKAQRDAAKKVVEADLRLLLSDVQKVADANPKKAEDVITSAGFEVKGSTSHSKVTGPKNGKVSGTVVIKAEEPGAHEWAQLADDGVTWITLRATRGAKKTVSGLTRLKNYTFKSAPILKEADGESDWTVYPPIEVL